MRLRDFTKLISLYQKVEPSGLEKVAQLSDPIPFLQFLARASGKRIHVDDFSVLQPWAIAALAAQGTSTAENKIFVQNAHATNPAQFAYSNAL